MKFVAFCSDLAIEVAEKKGVSGGGVWKIGQS